MTAKPNIVIVRIHDELHMFPLTGNGTLMNPSIPFFSDYDMTDSHIVFATFDVKNNISVEVTRFFIEDEVEDKPVKIIKVMESGEFEELVQQLFKEYEQGDNVLST